MAKLPVINRILKEDLKEAPSWIDKLLYPINTFIESVYNALNKNITFTDNIACQIKQISFTTQAAYTDGGSANWTDISFPNTLRNKAQGALFLDIREDNTIFIPATSNSSLSLSWIELEGRIIVKYITGLKNSTKYNITLLIL